MSKPVPTATYDPTPAPLPALWDKGEIYNDQIAPLVDQLMAICKEHRLPIVIAVQHGSAQDSSMISVSGLAWGGTAGGIYEAINAFSLPGKSLIDSLLDGDIGGAI